MSSHRAATSSAAGGDVPPRTASGNSGGTVAGSSSRGSGNFGGEFSQSLSSVLNAPHARDGDAAGVVTSLIQGDYSALWESPLKSLGLLDDGASSSSWVMPTVPPPPGGLPTVDVDDFREYLAEVGQLMARFQSIHPSGGSAAAGGGGADQGAAPNNVEEEAARLEALLENVPQLYFQRDFRLEDQATFDATGVAVAGFGEEEQGRLQEQLTTYLDSVEQNLMTKIQSRSEQFYRALDELQHLYTQVDETMTIINDFRGCMKRLDERLVGHALRIAQLRRRKKNMEELHRKVCLIATVRQTQHNLQLLLSCSDFVAALDLIAGAKQVLRTELAGVTALNNTAAQLNEMEAVVHKMLCSEFVSLCVGKDRMMRDTSGVLGDLGGGPEAGMMESSSLAEVEDQLLALALALLRVGMVSEVLSEYKAAAVREVLNAIKATLRGALPHGADNAAGDRAPLAERLRGLEFEAFLGVMRTIHRVLTSVLTRCSGIHGMVCAVLKAQEEEAAEGGGGGVSASELASLRLASADVLDHICETAHQRVGRLLAVREHHNTHVALHDFTRLFDETVEFVNASEKLCGRQKKHPLRATLLAQAKLFIEQLHSSNMTKLNLLLDQERWAQVDVPSEIQLLVNECLKPSDSFRDHFTAAAHRSSQPPAKQLVLDGDKFSMVGVMTALLKMVADYVACSVQLPALGPDIVQRLLDLVKVFNTRTCQLVLGARAMQLAGLKTITAKHLALSAQSVTFLLAFAPWVRDALRRHLPERQHVLLSGFDALASDLKAHRDEVYAKLVAIMKERLDYHCRTIENEAWNAPGATEEGSYIRQLAKELGSLHRALAGTLDPPAVHEVMSNIAGMMSRRLPEHFGKLSLATTASQKRVAADVNYLIDAFEGLSDLILPDKDFERLRAYVKELPAFRS